MILVGIDVAKDKHDCCIINSDGEFPEMVFQSLQPQSLCYFVDQLDTA